MKWVLYFFLASFALTGLWVILRMIAGIGEVFEDSRFELGIGSLLICLLAGGAGFAVLFAITDERGWAIFGALVGGLAGLYFASGGAQRPSNKE